MNQMVPYVSRYDEDDDDRAERERGRECNLLPLSAMCVLYDEGTNQTHTLHKAVSKG